MAGCWLMFVLSRRLLEEACKGAAAQMTSYLFVGLGGMLGAALRHWMGHTIPSQGVFPWVTLLINFLGAIAIGVLTELSRTIFHFPGQSLLFWKTGLCGGFTTFSTFSLEVSDLLEQGRWGMGLGYSAASVVLCVTGVFLGKWIIRGLIAAWKLLHLG